MRGSMQSTQKTSGTLFDLMSTLISTDCNASGAKHHAAAGADLHGGSWRGQEAFGGKPARNRPVRQEYRRQHAAGREKGAGGTSPRWLCLVCLLSRSRSRPLVVAALNLSTKAGTGTRAL